MKKKIGINENPEQGFITGVNDTGDNLQNCQ